MITIEVIINYPTKEEDLTLLEKNAAYIKAALIISRVEKLNISDEIKIEVLKNIITKLEKKL